MKYNVNKMLKLIVVGKDSFSENLFSIFYDLYQIKHIHIPKLLDGFIKLYLGSDYIEATFEAYSLVKSSLYKIIPNRQFYYNLVYNALKLDNTDYLTSRFKEIDINNTLTEEQCLDMAKSFKRNLNKFIDIAMKKDYDIKEKVFLD